MHNSTLGIPKPATFNLNHWAVQPPSIVQEAPVIWRALWVHKKVASAPMSSGVPKDPEGCLSETKMALASSFETFLCSAIMSICFWMRGVKMNPGQIALMVTPDLAFSRAAALVNPTIPCFAATQADLFTEATKPCTLAMFIILPHFLSFIPGKAQREVQKAELRLREMTFSHIYSGKSSTLLMCCIPALLTKISTCPK